MDNPLVSKRLTKKQAAQLASFTDPAVILETLSRNNWTVEESIEKLVEIAKGDGKESVKLGAIKYLNQLLLDAMQRSGLMVIAKKHTLNEDGTSMTFTGSIVSNSLKSQKEGFIVEDTDTKPEDIAPPRIIVEAQENQENEDGQDNQEAQEAQEEEKEAKEDDAGEIDMSVSKPPTGDHADAQFGGIATCHSGPIDTIHIL